LVCLFCISSLFSISQIFNPEYNLAFLQDEVASVRIITSQENLDFILNPENWGQDEVSATFIYEHSEGTDTLENIGFRLRGNTSLSAAKKSFKVSFTEFEPGRRWQGLKKLNLNGEHNDVSIMRAKLSWDLLREYGLAASRTSYIKLYINEEYRGVYLNVEHIDDVFVKSRFSEGNGNLYKCTWPADLNFLGANGNAYQNGGYELKTNEWWPETHNDLAQFISDLNQTNSEELTCLLPEILNIKTYIKNLALEVLIGHWDGHALNKNNFYLYNNLKEQRLEFIQYDLDNTLGIDWFGTDWSERDLYNWSAEWESRPLYESIMENPEWRNMFSYEVNFLLENHFNSEVISDKLTTWKNLIAPHVLDDTFYTEDYGFQYSDFLEADIEAWGNHVDQSILEYIENRVNSANSQLENIATPTGIFYATHYYPVWGENTLGILFETNADATPSAFLHYQIDQGSLQTQVFNPSGTGIYTTEIDFNDLNTEFSYQIEFSDDDFNLSFPCEMRTIPLNESSSHLIINEVMTDNESAISDLNGDFEDWAELYNSGSTSISLNEFYLTDSKDFPNKWRLPNMTLNPNEHALIWCDDDPEESVFHTNFQLENSGDDIYIFEPFQDGFREVDAIILPDLNDDESFGRENDADENWIIFNESTPNAPNGIVHITEAIRSKLVPYPNPTSDKVNFSGTYDFKLTNSIGEILLEGNSDHADFSALPSGTYVLWLANDVFKIIKT